MTNFGVTPELETAVGASGIVRSVQHICGETVKGREGCPQSSDLRADGWVQAWTSSSN